MRFRSAVFAAVATAAAVGCGFNQEGIPPARNQIFYPGGIVVDPGGNWLYVVNSNADLRFNDGTLIAVKLWQALKDRKDALVPGTSQPEVCSEIGFINQLSDSPTYCCWDALDHNVLNCDERQYVQEDLTVKIGSFGSAISLLPTGNGDGARLLVAVRGNSSITWIKVTNPPAPPDPTPPDPPAPPVPPAINCAAATSGFVECDEQHRISQTDEPVGIPNQVSTPLLLPEEPYALAVDDLQLLLYVGHLRSGFLSSIDLSVTERHENDDPALPIVKYGVKDLDVNPPKLIGTFPSIFPGDVNGSAGVTSLTVTDAKGINTGRVYATSRFLPRAGAFAPVSYGPVSDPPDPVTDNPQSFLASAGDIFVSPLPGAETRGIQVIPGIARTFMLQRTPPALVAFNTQQAPNNVPSDVLEMCNGPTFLHMHSPTGSQDDMQLFVTCFESGQVYVVDPYVPRLVSIIEVGRGPAGLAFSPADPGLAFVVGFGSNNVSVIDLKADSDTRYHVIQRIGFANPVPR